MTCEVLVSLFILYCPPWMRKVAPPGSVCHFEVLLGARLAGTIRNYGARKGGNRRSELLNYFYQTERRAPTRVLFSTKKIS